MRQFFQLIVITIIVFSALIPRKATAHGAFDDALKRFDALLAVTPEDALIWFQRSCLNLSHDEWQQALLDIERVDRLAPGKYPVDFVRGQALALGGLSEAARTVLDSFLKANPEHASALAVRARVFLQLNRPEDAFIDFRAALAKSATPEPDLYQEFADALTARGQQTTAASVLQEGLKKLGNIPSLISKALDLELATGQFDAALTRVDAMEQAAPRPEPWMARRAQILDQAGRKEEALVAWRTLASHIAALPNLERGSHAMSTLAEQAALHGALLIPPMATPLANISPTSTAASTKPSISITTTPVSIPSPNTSR